LFINREVKAVNIKPILVRLQNAMGRDDLVEQMVLHSVQTPSHGKAQSEKSVNLIVGYNSSPRSHTALDLALLIAHQTRLATKAEVTVQVVYVLEDSNRYDYENLSSPEDIGTSISHYQIPLDFSASSPSRDLGTPILSDLQLMTKFASGTITSVDGLEEAELILRQAICLAEEWKSSFKANLRFGSVAPELRKVVISEAASLLILGCNTANHPLVQKLGSQFPCSVLGIPNGVEDRR
jgi:nucleotide-binding universal stress UspA family protein